jgi:hypothetical protein
MAHQFKSKILTLLLLVLFTAGCAPQATPTPVDAIGTIAAQLASQMLTQTAAAYSPTPFPATDTPVPTASETMIPTPVETAIPQVIGKSPCYAGPGESYGLVSYISDTKEVEVLGLGNTPGWYVIVNHYYGSPCWISAEFLAVDPNSDFSNLPVFTP